MHTTLSSAGSERFMPSCTSTSTSVARTHLWLANDSAVTTRRQRVRDQVAPAAPRLHRRTGLDEPALRLVASRTEPTQPGLGIEPMRRMLDVVPQHALETQLVQLPVECDRRIAHVRHGLISIVACERQDRHERKGEQIPPTA